VADDIVTRLRKRHETEGWIDDPNVEVDAADEIERLREDVDRWKSLCERVLDYKLGSSDWQDIRVAYEMALTDYENRKNDETR
jgi:hypothetical protein